MKLVLSLLALLYFLLPHDLFPDVVLGWGWLDDLIVAYLLWRFFYRDRGLPFNFFQNRAGPDPSHGKQESKQQWRHSDDSSESTRLSKDPYEVLQISRDASQEEIRTAYKDLAGKYHPDKVLHLGEEFQAMAEERFKEIQEAYQELCDKQ
jgi:DnaJ like chaperone protein